MAKQKKEDPSTMSPTEAFLKKVGEMLEKGSGVVIDPNNIPLERFNTGSLKLDIELKGGYVKGTYIELIGFEASGKTTTCIEAARQFQENYPNEPILWLDLEKVFDKEYFEKLGVKVSDPSKFMLMRPRTGESAYDIMIEFAKTFKGGAIFLDSVSLMLPEKEDENDMGAAQMGAQARLMSQGLRKVFPHTSKNDTTLFFVNQLREKIGVMFGDPTTTSGGKSLAYYTRTRLIMSRVQGKNKEEAFGCNIKLKKATFGNEDAKIETHLLHTGGFDKNWEILELAEELELLEKSGSWYSYGETKIAQGRPAAYQVLCDNPELSAELEEKIRTHYGI